MASRSKLREDILKNPASFSDQQLASAIAGDLVNIYELSKTGLLGPMRKRRIEALLRMGGANQRPAPTQPGCPVAPPPGMQRPARPPQMPPPPPPFRGPGNPFQNNNNFR